MSQLMNKPDKEDEYSTFTISYSRRDMTFACEICCIPLTITRQMQESTYDTVVCPRCGDQYIAYWRKGILTRRTGANALYTDYPGLGMIKYLKGESKPLTLESVYGLATQFNMQRMGRAEYLFVSHQGKDDLSDQCHPTIEDIDQDSLKQRDLKMLYGLHVVVAPDLIGGAFMVGCLASSL